MTDGEALLRAILTDPDNDLPRLVYADWLEEAGQHNRADLIRVQIKLVHTASAELLAAERRLLGPVEDRVWQRRRDWALPEALRNDWPSDVGGCEWHRGFPAVWHCTLALWMAHGPALVLAVPVQRVVLIDREPLGPVVNPHKPERTWFRDDSDWVQRPNEACLLQPTLFELLESDALDIAMFDHARTYHSRAEALSALSEACLCWASAPEVRQRRKALHAKIRNR